MKIFFFYSLGLENIGNMVGCTGSNEKSLTQSPSKEIISNMKDIWNVPNNMMASP